VKELSEMLHVTPAYINAIESGNRTPQHRLISDYARVLNVDEEIIHRFNKPSERTGAFEKIMLKLLQAICTTERS
jgi:transcriptional regulator with XRE-family HTH domain